MNLTKRYIDSLEYVGENNRRHVVWDNHLSGFGIRVYPSGRKAFILSYRVDGRKRQLTIGNYGALTLKQGQERARRYLVEIVDGKDPLANRKKQAQAKSIKNLCALYLADAEENKKSWKDDKRRINNRIIPKWGSLRVTNLSRDDIKSLHTHLKRTKPYEANRMLELLSSMFSFAEQEGIIPENYPNPARKIKKAKEKKRNRWVTSEELPRLAQAISEEQSIYIKAVFWLYLLTGVRKKELLTLEWKNVDLSLKQITLPDTKSNRAHYLPLSEPAMQILRELPVIDNNPYVFTGHKENHHLVNIDKAWRRIRIRAEIKDVRLHDLRRTVGSMLAQAGNDLHLIGKVLNHSDISTTAIYARFAQDQMRTALDDHANKLLPSLKDTGIINESK